MRYLLFALVVLIAVAYSVPGMAAGHEAGERGKALFKDASFVDSQRACNSCHPNGRGLARAGSKSKFNIMGKRQSSLEDAVNFCIVNANKGKAIDKKSDDMKDLVAYIKSLGK